MVILQDSNQRLLDGGHLFIMNVSSYYAFALIVYINVQMITVTFDVLKSEDLEN